MIKKLRKIGSDGLMIYFNKEDQEIYGFVLGEIVNIDDSVFLKQGQRKKIKK